MRRAQRVVAATLLASALGAPSAAAAPTCASSATPATLSAQIAAAADGQTVCLASGDYGTWQGTGKAITLEAAPGATPVMEISLGAGDRGFTLAGLSGMGGRVGLGARDFTIRDSEFSSPISIDATAAGILLDRNRHDWNASYDGGVAGKIFVASPDFGFSGVTVRNSSIRNGNLDGIQLSAGIDAIGNVFENLCDTGTNHTDNIQYVDGQGGRIAGNLVRAGADCDTQGITSYDGGTAGVTIEDNVVDIRRPWGIELYADRDSIVRHNTVRWHAAKDCAFNIPCGQIDINRKSEDPAGSGTQVYDNLTTSVTFTNGSKGTAHHNTSGERASYVGPLDSFAGFRLAATSPAGLRAASDGLDAGARIDVAGAPGVPPPVPPAVAPRPRPDAAPVSSPAAQPAARQLVASYGFEERSGALVHDGSGAGNDGRILGARRTPAGRHGRALVFRRPGDRVRVPASAALRLGGRVTLEAWVRPARRARWAPVVLVRSGGSTAYGLFATRGRAASRLGPSRAMRVSGRLRPGRWTHIATTYNGSVLRIYVDGIVRSARRLPRRADDATASLTIGAGFRGQVDDVRVWSTALPGQSIRSGMRRAAGVPATS